jgi:hypothetical protein
MDQRQAVQVGQVMRSAVLTASAAMSAEMPKELRGRWCDAGLERSETKYRRCKYGDLIIERGSTDFVDTLCEILNVSKRSEYDWVTTEKCKTVDVPNSTEIMRLHYRRKGVYLYMKQLSEQ